MSSQTAGAALVCRRPTAITCLRLQPCIHRSARTARSGAAGLQPLCIPRYRPPGGGAVAASGVFRGCGRRGWPASVSRDHGILRLGAEVKAGYGLNVAPDPGSGYARELTGCAAGPELFITGILRARNCRQRKAGACGRYSYRDFVPRHGDQAWRFNAGRRRCRGHFYESGRCRLPGHVQQ
jgi:hypothetical protein